MIANKYKLIEKISQGSFGIVYKAENIRTKENVAIKLEKNTNEHKSLKFEAKIYQYLGKIDGFPQLKMFGTFDDINYMVIDLLGKPLSHMIHYYKAFSLKTTLILGIQIINRIKTLHESQLIHRDIKPSNFIFGSGVKSTNKLYLIDFGFAKRYLNNRTHIQENRIKNIIGSKNFVSLNVHKLVEPSRRDDLESCIYVILTMLFGTLEWFNNSCDLEIYNLKNNILNVSEVPTFAKTMLYYVRSLSFDETPDYEYIINVMKKCFNDNSFINDGKFEWTSL